MATAPWIAWHCETSRDAPWRFHSSDKIENCEHFGTWNRHQWTVNYIYLYVSIFTVKSLKMLWRAHGWRGLAGHCGAQPVSRLWQEASPWPMLTFGAKLRISGVWFAFFFSPSKGNVGVLPVQQEDEENHVISLIPCLLLSEGKPMSGYLITWPYCQRFNYTSLDTEVICK